MKLKPASAALYGRMDGWMVNGILSRKTAKKQIRSILKLSGPTGTQVATCIT